MNVVQLARVVLAFMHAKVPVEAHAFVESRPVTEARYEAFAVDLATEAIAEEPLLDLDSERTALVVAFIAAHESYYRADIMNCDRHGLGRAWGVLQFQGPRVLVCASWRQAIRQGLGMMRESFARCARLPMGDRLSLWTDGRCEVRWKRSRVRVLPALLWVIEDEGPDA